MEAISVKNLCVAYENNTIIEDLSLSIPKGKVSIIIGANGCGKSTFLRTLDRLHDLSPTVRITGEILYKGQNIYDPDIDVTWLRKQIGMIFQKPNPFPMSIYDNVAYGPRTHGIKERPKLDRIVEEALRGAALWDEVKDRLKSSALGLSGGQQQRLCIARSLAVEPDIILMDESTSALDPISTGKIEELALKLKERYTVIMVTHNMQQARRISDKCAFFWLGEMVEFAPTNELFNHPKDVRTQLYVSGSMG